MLEQTVAAPLENAINGVENMLYMSSTSSSNGVVQIQVTFDIGTDVDKAALNVNNRVKQAEPRLPQEVRRQGVTVEKGSSAFLQVLAFYSPDGRYDDLFIVELRDAQRARRDQARARARPTCRSSAPRTTRCASGCGPTAWRSSSSRRPT